MILIASVVMAGGAVMATHAGDAGTVGPLSADNGYPIWYRDAHGTEVELCLEFTNALCGFIGNEIPDPGSPISFPGNFPGEAFWWSGESSIDNGAQSALLVMAVEAAFASGETALAGDQVSFGRVRIRLDGLVPDATYTVTHPYGTTIVTAEPDGSVFVTQDIGSLTTPADFSLALDSPVLDGLLEWDATLPAPPVGYLGDPGMPHTVIGSPTGNNLFSVVGPGLPAGSFVSSDFFVMGKRAVTSGVEALRAVYVNPPNPGASDYLEVFAKSRPNQTIHVSGVGINTVAMRGDGDMYHAKILVPGTAPAEITATNDTDGTSWTAPVADLVTITSAEYDVDLDVLMVQASSSDGSGLAVLTAKPGGVLTAGSLTAPLLAAPLDVTVTSSGGGSDTEPVRLIGGDFPTLAVTAVASASPATAIPGQVVTLDGAGSTGDITTYLWEQLSGTPVTFTDPAAATTTFTAPAVTESLLFQLTVTGAAGSDSASVTVEIVAGQPVVANAGTDQSAIVGTTVTLDGSGSTGASTYEWAQLSGESVTIADPAAATTTFTMPVSAVPLEFQLTAGNGTVDGIDTVVITQVEDNISVARAELRTRNGQLRVDGSVTVFTVPNVVSIYVGDGAPGRSGALIGTATVDPIDGTFSFRLGNGVTLPNNTLDLVTSRGGFLDEQSVTTRN